MNRRFRSIHDGARMGIRPRRRVRRSARGAWRPVALRWRQARVRGAAMLHVHRSGVNHFAAQVHLRFAFSQGAGPAPARTAPLMSSAPIMGRRAKAALVWRPSIVSGPAGQSSAGTIREITRSPMREVRTLRFHDRQSIMRKEERRTRTGALSFRWRGAGAEAVTPVVAAKPDGIAQRGERHGPARARPGFAPVALDHVRRPMLARPAPAGRVVAARDARPSRLSRRPAELLWRPAPEEPASFGGVAGVLRDAAASNVPGPSGNVGSWAASSPSAPRPVAPDPAWVDRLTEDVIGRVERRARIERERRGG